jgi:hypothetical protein
MVIFVAGGVYGCEIRQQLSLVVYIERYPKLPFLKPLTCDDACEMPGFG